MISVIVPAYNAEKTIKGCLEALLNQDYNGNYEIIMVDDGSTDSTADIILSYKTVRLIKQPNAGPAAARNKGASEAKGEIILFTDSDCVPERDWIRMMTEPFEQDMSVIGVKGAYRTRQREIAARFVQFEYEDKYDKMKKDETIDFIDTYSAAFRRDIFLKWAAMIHHFQLHALRMLTCLTGCQQADIKWSLIQMQLYIISIQIH